MALSPKALEMRKRLAQDFEFYAKNCLFIRTKDQKIAPFVLNRAQRELLVHIMTQLEDRGFARIIILKARQLGLSTFVGGFLYWWVSHRMAQKALVVAHKSDATQTLFDMTRRYHEKVPEAVKPSTKYSSRKELVFDRLDSSYTVVTAGGDGIARSETITAAHLSELAFWPAGVARENYSGLMDTIPNSRGTIILIESTGNGVSGLFYEQWKAAEEGTSLFQPVFFPWFIDTGYVLPVPKNMVLTPDETDLCALVKRVYGASLSRGQLAFRRAKIAEKGLDLFNQEYPTTPEDAFLTTGRPVFSPGLVTDLIRAAPEPIGKFGYEGGEWIEHPRGELTVFEPRDPHESYYIGADVGAGVQRDWSVAQVLDGAGRQVASYRAQVDPDYFATHLEALGRHYNEALIIVESNNHGILTCTRLGKDMAYPNFYTQTVYDRQTDSETTKLGFATNVKSKPLIIDKLRADLRAGAVVPLDKTTLEEMRAFVVTPTGKMEAEKGCHDDCVMALALANFVNAGRWQPIINQDSWYVKTI